MPPELDYPGHEARLEALELGRLGRDPDEEPFEIPPQGLGCSAAAAMPGPASIRTCGALGAKKRFPSLPAKYAELLRLAASSPVPCNLPPVTCYAVWDDDDIYLPWHLAAHAETLAEHGWSHPSKVWSTYRGKPELENAAGRFHGALALDDPFLRTACLRYFQNRKDDDV